ncbi:hypothetical protein PTKIN_Ptkin14bG0148100 [Pterospermum kingtungense]
MAWSAVFSAVTRIGDLLAEEATYQRGVEEQVHRLHRELQWMQSFLMEADATQAEDRTIQLWVSEIRDLAYDAEDVADAFAVKMRKVIAKLFRLGKTTLPKKFTNMALLEAILITWLGCMSLNLHELEFLKDAESWELFQKIAFPDKDSPDYRADGRMEELGKNMVKRCGGLPLAIIVLGEFWVERIH